MQLLTFTIPVSLVFRRTTNYIDGSENEMETTHARVKNEGSMRNDDVRTGSQTGVL